MSIFLKTKTQPRLDNISFGVFLVPTNHSYLKQVLDRYASSASTIFWRVEKSITFPFLSD